MKRKLLLIIALSLTFIITACGMTPEEIDTELSNLSTSYESGTYDKAKTEVEKLDKAYKKMSDEQKSKFEELRNSVEYAVSSIQAINDSLNNVQSLYDQTQYYEAQQALADLSQNYSLPPNEQKQFDEKSASVSQAITEWEITEAFQKVESAFNSSDYSSAETELLKINVESLSDEQNQSYQTWQKKIYASKSLSQAESYYNNGSYVSASNTLSGIDSTYLTDEQNQTMSSLKSKIATAQAEAERKKRESEMPAYVVELKKFLGVPDYLDVTYKISNPFYWPAGERTLISVTFYYNGQCVAGANIDYTTHEPMTSILGYTGIQSY